MKKILYITLGLLLVATVGVGAYFLFQKKNGGEPTGTLSFFGFGGPKETPGSSPTDKDTPPASSTDPAALASTIFIKKIHAAPVAGFGIDSDTSKNTVVRYQEKALGHIYETFLFDNAETSVLDNTTPKVSESLWGRGGDDVITRNIEGGTTIKTTALRISSQKNSLFPENISGVALSPDKRSVFFLSPSGQGATGSVSTLDGTGKKTVFSSLFREWLPSWTSPSYITLATKPSARVNGSIYLLNTQSLSSQVAIANKPGLTGVLSPDGKTILYTESTAGGMQTNYYTVSGGKINVAPFTTLPEKCVWSTKEAGVTFCALPSNIPSAEYPDSWYRGDVSFSDSIWKFDTRNTADLGRVVISNVPGESVDAVSLALDSEEKYLLFINKKDGSLWGIDLTVAAPADMD